MKVDISSSRRITRIAQLKTIVPITLGIFTGLLLNFYQESPFVKVCDKVNDNLIIPRHINSPQEDSKNNVKSKTQKPLSNVTKVKPKESRFNYGSRPYFVYSELGFRYPLIVAVQTTESHLLNYAVALNNTFTEEMPKVVFFTPYSKGDDFKEKYIVKLNLNVVQLPDIIDGESTQTEFSFRIMKYMKDHFIQSYNWYMHIHDNIYVNPEKLVHFLNPLNSSSDFYLGHSTTKYFDQKQKVYCDERTGIVLSRTTLLKLPFNNMKQKDSFEIALADLVSQNAGVSCEYYEEVQNAFVLKSDEAIETLPEDVLAYGPVSSPNQIIKLHKSYILRVLDSVRENQRELQQAIKDLQPKIPKGVPEKTLSWPIGHPRQSKPNTRFEVIRWVYFDKKNIYGLTDETPISNYTHAYQQDYDEIMNTVSKTLNIPVDKLDLVTGYRRLDPKRGGEYIVDIRTNTDEITRVNLLRPFSKIEALPMPAATEQKGINIVLPVTKELVGLYEPFLQMFQRICLQTGENVVLLTVFINLRETNSKFEGDTKDDVFADAKELIARYKSRYMWAQLPWLQVGVKQPSNLLVMDIVSMKLPANALIFMANLNSVFTTNFLNRCRVNVVNGMQVFFPIPFAEYNPAIVSRSKSKVPFTTVHADNGQWKTDEDKLACFNNNDYKELRMHQDNFLDEKLTNQHKVYDVFQASKFQVFRAVDSELRHRFTHETCKAASCIQGSRSQLAKLLFDKEIEKSKEVEKSKDKTSGKIEKTEKNVSNEKNNNKKNEKSSKNEKKKSA